MKINRRQSTKLDVNSKNKVEADKDPDAMRRLGYEAFEADNIDEAKIWYEKAAALAGDDYDGDETDRADNFIALGITEFDSGNIKEAKKWWTRAAEIDLWFVSNFAWTSGGSEDEKIIFHLYEIAAKMGDSQSMYGLGVKAEDEGDLEKAKSLYLAASPAAEADDGGDIRATWMLGLIALSEDNLLSAKEFFEEVATDEDAYNQRNAALIMAFVSREFNKESDMDNWIQEWRDLEDEELNDLNDLIDEVESYSINLATFCLEFAVEEGMSS